MINFSNNTNIGFSAFKVVRKTSAPEKYSLNPDYYKKLSSILISETHKGSNDLCIHSRSEIPPYEQGYYTTYKISPKTLSPEDRLEALKSENKLINAIEKSIQNIPGAESQIKIIPDSEKELQEIQKEFDAKVARSAEEKFQKEIEPIITESLKAFYKEKTKSKDKKKN